MEVTVNISEQMYQEYKELKRNNIENKTLKVESIEYSSQDTEIDQLKKLKTIAEAFIEYSRYIGITAGCEMQNAFWEIELQDFKKIWYEYEMFFKSEPNDFCKIDGWHPIATDKIKNIDKVEEYISSGLLRKVSCNDR